MTNKNNEKILKILIGIGIIAIFVSIYAQYLKPFMAELSVQKKDQTKIRNLSSINSALNKLQEINPNFFLGEPNKVYISLPSSQLNCEDLDLPLLPSGWEYRCQSESKFREINGNGWIPVDFTQLSDNSFLKFLPVDPANSASDLSYYTYITGEGWVLTSLLGSNKFIKKSALNDGGIDPARFEIGSDLQLWAMASGLAGYWKFDEGEGATTADSSGNNNTGILTNGPNWVKDKIGKALNFDGANDYVDAGNPASLQLTGNFSISFWFQPVDIAADNRSIIDKGFNKFITLGHYDSRLYFGYPSVESSIFGVITLSAGWNHYVVTWDRTNIKLYLNGKLDKSQAVTMPTDQTANWTIGRNSYGGYYKGTIDEVHIYNRMLSAKEIQMIYNAIK